MVGTSDCIIFYSVTTPYLVFGHHELLNDDNVGEQQDTGDILQEDACRSHHAEAVFFCRRIAERIGESDFAQLLDGCACVDIEPRIERRENISYGVFCVCVFA